MRVMPKIWTGGDVWIIGGGPSVIEQFDIPSTIVEQVRNKEKDISSFSPYLSSFHDKHIIGINMAFKLGSWVDIMMFGDFKFFATSRKEIADFSGIKVSCHKRFRGAEFAGENIRHYSRSLDRGLTTAPDKIVWHGNTGAASINLAYHLGAKRVFLLGFDMDLNTEGYQHFHNEYTMPGEAGKKQKDKSLPFARHSRGFPDIAKAARKLDMQIINVSPNSKINSFQKMTVEEALKL